MTSGIRCPHCERPLMIERIPIGQRRRCPWCSREFTVEAPAAAPPRRDVAISCPGCHARVAPGATFCRRCLTNVDTGLRLPLRQRMLYWSPLRWGMLGLFALVVVIGVAFGTEAYRARQRKALVATASAPAPATQPDAVVNWAKRLVEAGSAEQRAEAVAQLRQSAGSQALTTLVQEWESGAAGAPADQRIANERATLDLLAESGDARWAQFARDRLESPGLSLAAKRALLIFGDASQTPALVEEWTERLRSRMFAERLIELAGGDEGRQAALRRISDQVVYVADAMQLADPRSRAAWLTPLLDGFWASWRWLGQNQGERYTAELFELVKPHRSANADFKERIRGARRVLDEASQQAGPTAAAVAGVTLAQLAPQYESLRGRIIARLASALPQASPVDQQRLAWSLARLEHLRFAEMSGAENPVRFQRAAIEAAIHWATQAGYATAPTPVEGRTPQPPSLTRRVVTPQRQLESLLLLSFYESWEAMRPALDRWRSERLGVTPRVFESLHPGQRMPTPSAWSAAVVIVAENNAQTARESLEIWSQAIDQPAWMRAFAATGLAVLNANVSQRDDWPTPLTDAAFTKTGQDRPSWELWGRLLASGGERLWTRLQRADSLSPATRDKLIYEAQQAAQWRRDPRTP